MSSLRVKKRVLAVKFKSPALCPRGLSMHANDLPVVHGKPTGKLLDLSFVQ